MAITNDLSGFTGKLEFSGSTPTSVPYPYGDDIAKCATNDQYVVLKEGATAIGEPAEMTTDSVSLTCLANLHFENDFVFGRNRGWQFTSMTESRKVSAASSMTCHLTPSITVAAGKTVTIKGPIEFINGKEENNPPYFFRKYGEGTLVIEDWNGIDTNKIQVVEGTILYAAAADSFAVTLAPNDLGIANPTPNGNVTDCVVGKGYELSATAMQELVPNRSKAVLTGWTHQDAAGEEITTGTDNPHTVVYAETMSKSVFTWNYDVQNLLEVGVNDSALGSVTGGATGWLVKDAFVTLTAVPAEGSQFVCWVGDVPSGTDATATSLELALDVPRNVQAVFADSGAFVWKRLSSGNYAFEDAENWSAGAVPGAGDKVTIPLTAGVKSTITVNSALDIGSLDVGGAADGSLNIVFATGFATNKVSGDVIIRAGATVSHEKHWTTDEDVVAKHKLILEVGGGLTISENGAIDVTGCGYGLRWNERAYTWKGASYGAKSYNGNYGPGSGTFAASYGGRGNLFDNNTQVQETYAGLCYGSVKNPTDLGSSGTANAPGSGNDGSGGGAAILTVAGAVTVNGKIAANSAYAVNGGGSGGSVNVKCATFAGTGAVEAFAYANSSCGGGGRIAIVQTVGTDFSDWTGTITAWRRPGISETDNRAGGAGTIYLKGAADKGKVLVSGGANATKKGDPAYAQTYLPVDDSAAAAKELRGVTLELDGYARVFINADMTLGDIDLKSKNLKLYLCDHTLSIKSKTHKDGEGWADTMANLVDLGSESPGEIIWLKPQGVILMIK